MARQSRMFFTATSPSRYERFNDRLLGVLRSAPWWRRWKSTSALPKKSLKRFKPAISPFRAGPRLNGPQGASKPPADTKSLAVGGPEPAKDLHVRRRKFWTGVR